MTPAVLAARRAEIEFAVHEYRHDREAASYGREAADKLGLDADSVFKTLVARLDDGRLAVAVVPVERSLDLKSLARALGVRKAAIADVAEAERATGYVVGGISPLGQRSRLNTVIDRSALQRGRVFVSAGRRGLEIELDPKDLVRLCGATTAELAR